MLELRGVDFSFSHNTIFQNYNLSISSEQIFILKGANGSGKTTLLNLCNGYLIPQKGIVQLNGRLIKEWSSKQRAQRIVMLSAELPNSAFFTAAQMIRLGFYAYNLPAKQESLFMHRILNELAIQDLQHKKCSELSLGQQRLVSVGRFLAQCYPAVQSLILLLDEPFNYLDEQNKFNVINLLRALVIKNNCGVVLATHEFLSESELFGKPQDQIII
jgi:iron complex transport system ATP-binding protein